MIMCDNKSYQETQKTEIMREREEKQIRKYLRKKV